MILHPMMPVLSFKHMEINSTQQKKKAFVYGCSDTNARFVRCRWCPSAFLLPELQAGTLGWDFPDLDHCRGCLPCPASAAFGVRDHKGCAGLGGTRRGRLAAAQSCGFSAACAGGTTFLAGDARGAPGRGSACMCTQPCSSLRPSECLGSGQEPARCCTTTGSRGCVRPWEGLCCPSACSWCLLLLLAKVFRAGCAAECSWTHVEPQSFSLFLLSNFTEENHFQRPGLNIIFLFCSIFFSLL